MSPAGVAASEKPTVEGAPAVGGMNHSEPTRGFMPIEPVPALDGVACLTPASLPHPASMGLFMSLLVGLRVASFSPAIDRTTRRVTKLSE
jgi:hypothetical protein